MTPEGKLFHAVKYGDYVGVDAALESGVDYKLLRIDGKPLLQIAGELGRRQICERLVRAGADVNESDGARQFSILHHAAACSNYGLASVMLDLGANPTPLASNNSTPLHIAARSGQGYLARNLIKHGASLDAADKRGLTPLHWAVEKEDVAMVKLLIEKGCDVTLFDKRFRSALSIAMANGNNDIRDLLRSHGATLQTPTSRPASKVAEQSPNEGRLI